MDYNAEMLKLYFREKNFSKEKIRELLETNPFDVNYAIWEKQVINNNKTFAIKLKRENMINQKVPIQEIAIHKNNIISKYLTNDVIISECSLSDNLNDIKLKNRLILLNGCYYNEYDFLKKLQKKSIPFITGICSKNYSYYNYVLYMYKNILKYLKNCELLTCENGEQHILILKTK